MITPALPTLRIPARRRQPTEEEVEDFDLEREELNLDGDLDLDGDLTPSEPGSPGPASFENAERWEWGSDDGVEDNDDIRRGVDELAEEDEDSDDEAEGDTEEDAEGDAERLRNTPDPELGPRATDPLYQFCPPAHRPAIL